MPQRARHHARDRAHSDDLPGDHRRCGSAYRGVCGELATVLISGGNFFYQKCLAKFLARASHLLQHLAHLAMDEIDGLERSDHHTELDDLAFVVASNDVNAIDVLSLHGGLEFENGGVAREDLLRVAEAL